MAVKEVGEVENGIRRCAESFYLTQEATEKAVKFAENLKQIKFKQMVQAETMVGLSIYLAAKDSGAKVTWRNLTDYFGSYKTSKSPNAITETSLQNAHMELKAAVRDMHMSGERDVPIGSHKSVFNEILTLKRKE